MVEEFGADYPFGLERNQDGILSRAERLMAQQEVSPLRRNARGTSTMIDSSVVAPARVEVSPEVARFVECWLF